MDTTRQQGHPRHYLVLFGSRRTVTQWSRLYRIETATVISRLKRGWNPLTALLVKPFLGRPVLHQGQTLTVRAWAQRLGIPEDTLNQRLCRGWTVERALTQPVQVKGRRNV